MKQESSVLIGLNQLQRLMRTGCLLMKNVLIRMIEDLAEKRNYAIIFEIESFYKIAKDFRRINFLMKQMITYYHSLYINS